VYWGDINVFITTFITEALINPCKSEFIQNIFLPRWHSKSCIQCDWHCWSEKIHKNMQICDCF